MFAEVTLEVTAIVVAVVLLLVLYRWYCLGPESLITSYFLLSLYTVDVILSYGGPLDITTGSAAVFHMSADDLIQARGLFLLAFLEFTVASIICGLAIRLSTTAAQSRARPVGNFSPRESRSVAIVIPRRVELIGVTLSGLFFLTEWLISGSDLLQRPNYFFLGAGSVAAALAYLDLPLAAVMLYLHARSSSAPTRMSSGTIALLLFVTEFARGSRGAAAIVLLWAVIGLLNRRRPVVVRVLQLGAGAVVAFLALVLAIQFRGISGDQGLFPYVGALLDGTVTLNPDTIQSGLNNLYQSVPITVLSAQRKLPGGFLGISLSPFSGASAGWYLIYPSLSLSFNTPSNAIGQVMALGGFNSLVAWVCVAGLLSLCSLSRVGLSPRFSAVAVMIASVLTVAADLQFLQYALRSGMRFIWAAVAISFILRILSAFGTAPSLSSRFEPLLDSSAPR